MATGASTCDLAILLIDARKGVLDQTRRHSFISTLLGIKHLVVAVNKMDLVNFSEEKFDEIRQSYLTFAEQLPGNLDIRFVPLSALEGDNVASQSANMPWYSGPTLLEVLETVEIQRVVDTQPMRFPVQYVNRPNLDFRGFSGTDCLWQRESRAARESAAFGRGIDHRAHRDLRRRPAGSRRR
jgi:sulfate adenylyltransferase subunit 1